MRAFKDQKYTLEEYLDLERNSDEKWEYWDGKVWCMSGASEPHEHIVSNLLVALRGRLPSCRVYASNLKVGVPTFPPYRYPDLTVVCGTPEIAQVGGMDVLINPQLIIEVLSPSTEAFDRGSKFTYYKSIPTLTDYVLVATDRAYVTYFQKHSETEWVQTEAIGIGTSIRLQTFDTDLLLAEVYLDIDFPEPIIRNPEDDLLKRA